MSSPSPRDVAAQALDDLRAGHVTEAVLAAVRISAAAIARTGEHTTPSGSRHWSSHDVDDLVSDFFSKEGRIEAVAARAGTGPEAIRRFRGALRTSLVRVIIGRFRATPRGVLRRRIERRMDRRDDVVTVPPNHWALEAHKHLEHWGGDDGPLVSALENVPVDPPPKWDEDSDRQAPVTTPESIDLACWAVLGVASRPVDKDTVLRLIVERILPFDPNVVIEAGDDDDQAATPEVEWQPDPEAKAAAERLWSAMSPDDRTLLPHIRTSPRTLAMEGLFGLQKSALEARQAKLKLRVEELTNGISKPADANRWLLHLYTEWATGQNKGGES